MNSDVARFIRLKHSIQALEKSSDVANGGEALRDKFNQLRDEVRSALPEELLEEFERLFPSMYVGHIDEYDLMGRQIAGANAKTNLTALAGWLEGHIEAEKAAR